MIQIRPLNEYSIDATTPSLVLKESFAKEHLQALIELAENEVFTTLLHDLHAITIQLTMMEKIPFVKGKAYSDAVLEIERIIVGAAKQYASKK